MDQQTIEAYNQYAQQYDQETTNFWTTFPVAMLDTFAELKPATVLDIGCGPGRDALLLKNCGLAVTCLDASETMVKICQEKGLEALQGDLLNLPFAQESFAGVWAYTSLLHVPKKDFPKALQEIFRVLQPEGVLGLGLIEGDTEEYRTSEKVPAPRLFSYFTMPEVSEHLRQNGFSLLFQEQFQPNSRKYLHVIAKKK